MPTDVDVDLKAAVSKLHQHVKCPTKGVNALNGFYSTIKQGFRARELPHLGQSDHISLLLKPAYSKGLRGVCRTALRRKIVVFEHQDLEQYTIAVLECGAGLQVEDNLTWSANPRAVIRKAKQILFSENTLWTVTHSTDMHTDHTRIKKHKGGNQNVKMRMAQTVGVVFTERL